MSMRDAINKEGFWYSESEPTLPRPVPNDEKWDGQDQFILALRAIERRAIKTAYRGWSNCRVCKSANGNCEFRLENWVWPSGYIHYIEKHNVKPSEAFRNFVLRKEDA